MKKYLINIGWITGLVVLLLPAVFVQEWNGFLIGVAALALSILWLFVGLVLSLGKSRKNKDMGQAFLITAGVLLLLSFTLCSTSAAFL